MCAHMCINVFMLVVLLYMHVDGNVYANATVGRIYIEHWTIFWTQTKNGYNICSVI